jgi:hypothetical protein
MMKESVKSINELSSDDSGGNMTRREGLETLLELDGTVLVQEGSYWVHIRAWQVQRSQKIRHGVRYSLTLHNTAGERILGYDNAHLPTDRKSNFSAVKKTRSNDHRHPYKKTQSISYEYQSAYQLLTDFFTDVDSVLKEELSS